MRNNKYSWNETLKFSWGHIIAFVALIYISYVAFMGDYYSNGGNFKSSAIKVFFIDFALTLTFIGAQIYKGADEKFGRSIIIERILIALCPIVFLLAMIPYNHFWSVFSERSQIEPKFASAIEKSRQIFVNYDNYSKDRISAYSETLSNVIADKQNCQDMYIKAGFSGNNDDIIKESYVATLRLQLLSQNTDSLRTSALKWINEANQGASVWNAFLVGNIDMITDAIEGWSQKLHEVSIPVLSNERMDTARTIVPFDQNRESFKSANAELISLRNLFVKSNGLSLFTVISGCLLLLMLLFPYFLQRRNEKAKGYYALFPHGKTTKSKNNGNQISTEHEPTVIDVSMPQSSDDIYGGTF